MSARWVKLVKSAKRGRKLSRKLKRQILWVTFAFLLLLFGSAYVVWSQERHMEGSFLDSLWTILFTLIGQGEFATSPRTFAGRMVVFILSIVGVAMLGVIFSELIQRLMSSKLKELMGMSHCKFKGHTIICGWNEGARLILKELLAMGQQVAVVARERPNSLSGGDVFFVAGSVADEECLDRAGVREAKAAIILAERVPGISDVDVDARTIMAGLAIEAANSDVYTVIELIRRENERHARHANVDDIIFCDDMIANVAAASAVHAGISVFLKDVLCASDDGHRFSAEDVPQEYDGKTVGQLFSAFRARGALPVALILPPPEEGVDVHVSRWRSEVNPDEGRRIVLPAKIVTIARNR
jgi:voltage-gated potassium channel